MDIFPIFGDSFNSQNSSGVQMSESVSDWLTSFVIFPNSGSAMFLVCIILYLEERVSRHLLFGILTSLWACVDSEVTLHIAVS